MPRQEVGSAMLERLGVTGVKSIPELRELAASSRPTLHVVSRELSGAGRYFPLVKGIAATTKREGGRHLFLVQQFPEVKEASSDAIRKVRSAGSYAEGVRAFRPVARPYETIVDSFDTEEADREWRSFLLEWRDAFDNMSVVDRAHSGDALAHFKSYGARANALLLKMGLSRVGVDVETVEPRGPITFYDGNLTNTTIDEGITRQKLGLELRSRDNAQVLILPAQTGNMIHTLGSDVYVSPGFVGDFVNQDAVIAAQAITMARLANAGKLNFWVEPGTGYRLDEELLKAELGAGDTRVNFAYLNGPFYDWREYNFREQR